MMRIEPVRCSPTSCAACISVSSASDRTCSFFSLGLPPKRVTRPAACHVAPEQSWPAFSSSVTPTPRAASARVIAAPAAPPPITTTERYAAIVLEHTL